MLLGRCGRYSRSRGAFFFRALGIRRHRARTRGSGIGRPLSGSAALALSCGVRSLANGVRRTASFESCRSRKIPASGNSLLSSARSVRTRGLSRMPPHPSCDAIDKFGGDRPLRRTGIFRREKMRTILSGWFGRHRNGAKPEGRSAMVEECDRLGKASFIFLMFLCGEDGGRSPNARVQGENPDKRPGEA